MGKIQYLKKHFEEGAKQFPSLGHVCMIRETSKETEAIAAKQYGGTRSIINSDNSKGNLCFRWNDGPGMRYMKGMSTIHFLFRGKTESWDKSRARKLFFNLAELAASLINDNTMVERRRLSPETLNIENSVEKWLFALHELTESECTKNNVMNLGNDFATLVTDGEFQNLFLGKEFAYLRMIDDVFIKSFLVCEYISQPQKIVGRIKLSEQNPTEASGVQVPILKLIEQGESTSLEFKETLEFDTKQQGKNKDVLLSSLKTIAALLNTKTGGTFLIGVDDSGKIRGIERDLSLMKSGNTDKFELKIRNCLKDRFKPQPISKVNISFEKFTEGTICRVDVQTSKEIVHLDNEVYVRDGNTTQKLEGRALTDWIQQRRN